MNWTPPSACEECGADDWLDLREGLIRGTLEFLWMGGPWRPHRWKCRRCGAEDQGSGGVLFWHGHTRFQWLRPLGVPWRIVMAVRGARSITPTPAAYLVAGATGCAVGVVLDVTLSWPWWLAGVSFVATAWIFFLSTAMWGVRGDVGEEILGAISPAKASERSERRLEEAFRTAPFPLFGLPMSWQGVRSLSGWSRSDRGTTALSLRHGHPLDETASRLTVEVAAQHVVPRFLAESFWHEVERPPAGLEPEEFFRWSREQRRRVKARPNPEWETVTISVEGLPEQFKLIREGQAWRAYGTVEGITLTVTGERYPVSEVELVRIRDVEPYIEGTRRFHEEMRSQHTIARD